MKSFAAALLFVCFGATNASALSCGPSEHVIRAEQRGFVPDVMYFCQGSTVKVTNNTGKRLRFSYKSSNSLDTVTNWVNDGSTVTLSNPGNGPFMPVTEQQEEYETGKTYYCYRYGWKQCNETATRTVYPNYYSDTAVGTLKVGMAPDSY